MNNPTICDTELDDLLRDVSNLIDDTAAGKVTPGKPQQVAYRIRAKLRAVEDVNTEAALHRAATHLENLAKRVALRVATRRLLAEHRGLCNTSLSKDQQNALVELLRSLVSK